MVISFLIKPMFPGLLPVKVTYEDWANFIEQNKKWFVMPMIFLDTYNLKVKGFEND